MADRVRLTQVAPGDYSPEVLDSIIGTETTLRLPCGHRQPATVVDGRVEGTRLTTTIETEQTPELLAVFPDIPGGVG